LTHTFLILVTVGPGHGVYRKCYTLVRGQRAEKFENHCSNAIKLHCSFHVALCSPNSEHITKAFLEIPRAAYQTWQPS